MAKHYLGDGVFAEFDPATLNTILTTEDGIRVTNRIVLEAEVLDALGSYVQREIYARQAPRQPLDARAHAGDGDGAALEAGAVIACDGIGTREEIKAAARRLDELEAGGAPDPEGRS